MKKNILIICLFLFSITPWIATNRLFFLSDPKIWPDEVVFADAANNFRQTGKFFTTTNGFTRPVYVILRPAYLLALSAWTAFFGSNIESIRSLSVIISLFSLAAFFSLIQSQYKNLPLSLTAVFLLSLDRTFQTASRLGRVEIMGILLIILSLLSLSLSHGGQNRRYLFLSGILTALAVLTHPIILFLPLALGLYLFFSGKDSALKLKEMTILFMPLLTAVSFYLLYLFATVPDPLGIISGHLTDKEATIIYLAKTFVNNRTYTLLYLYYFSLWTGLIFLFFRTGKRTFLLPFIGLLVAVIFIFIGREPWYIVYLEPFVLIGLIQIMAKISRPVFSSLLILIFLTLHLHLLFLSPGAVEKGNYYDFCKLIAQNLSPNSSVFLTSIPDPYFCLKGRGGLKLREFPTLPPTPDEYFESLKKVDFIIYNMVEDLYLKDYMTNNAKRIIKIKEPGGYDTAIIQLVPKDRRI